MDDRGSDVLAGQRESFLGFSVQLGVVGGVLQRVGQLQRQPCLGQCWFQEATGPAVAAVAVCGVWGGVEHSGPDRRVERSDRGAAVFGPGLGRDAEQLQPGGGCRRYSPVIREG